MQYSIIYSIDVPWDTSVKPFLPPNRKLWQQTEGDDQYDYGYLEGYWTKGKHRKLCTVLTQEQFDAFVDHCGLYASTIETMGSLGAPGFGYGMAPAISFDADHQDAIVNAYVTPIPESLANDRRKRPFNERDWRRLRKTLIKRYAA